MNKKILSFLMHVFAILNAALQRGIKTMKRKGKQMVTAVLSTAMLFTMSSMPVYAEENVEAQINEIDGVGTSVDSPKFAIGNIQLAGGQVGQAYSEMLSVEEGAVSSWEIV